MINRIVTVILSVGIIFGVISLVAGSQTLRLPGNHQNYEPTQPIGFSHRQHAGDLQIDCLYCHIGAEQSRHAGIPATSICMNCHQFVTATMGAVRAEDNLATEQHRKPQLVISAELRKLYDAMALDESLTPLPDTAPVPVPWIKVHNLPDYVYFDHRAHTLAGVDCQRCHGAVESMERVRQVEDLTMGWCVNCHRRVNETGIAGQQVTASTDCVTCHY